MLKFRTCPKCKGDLIIDRDYYGWYEQCLQCGYEHDLPNMVAEEIRSQVKVGKGVARKS